MTISKPAANDDSHSAQVSLHRVMPAEACSDFGFEDGLAKRRSWRELLIWLAFAIGAFAVAGWKACEAGAC